MCKVTDYPLVDEQSGDGVQRLASPALHEVVEEAAQGPQTVVLHHTFRQLQALDDGLLELMNKDLLYLTSDKL